MRTLPGDLHDEIEALPTKAAKIRALDARGFARAEIARFLDIRYQHVRNVLERSSKGHARTAASLGSPAQLAPVSLTIDSQGRIQLPPEVRDAIALDPDGRVSARVEDGELHLITPRVALRKLRQMARDLAPGGYAIVDEFIAEKRREAELE